ncbi:permease [Xenorhabdus budapestensis]|uniref:Putative two-component membrane permease complex subunit n=1 Tax=Xenorhabdus budapestensis TaxID=290110 RepID=A0A2D0ILW5_XENBU|nr:permease [Xenorhabdus budapestensis]PHM22773.1 putative two-component membrane permease complex subunit [Xenorhabdus budapestensis]
MNLNTFTETMKFFAIISGELIVLFLIVSFIVAMMQEYVPASTVQRLLTGRGLRGNIVGAGLGAVTPFCSCSTIPVTVGLLNAGAPFGATMSFLISSPILNPVILGLLVTLFGWKFTLFYAVSTFILAVVVGVIWQFFGLEKDIKKVRVVGEVDILKSTDFKSRLFRAGHSAFSLFKTSLPYLLIGAGIGSLIYGVVPGEWIANVAGTDNPFAVPVAAAIGVPLYIRAETLIPIGMALQAQGMSIGAVAALIIAGAGASIPEVTLLNTIFRPRLVSIFVLTIFTVAIGVGYIANLLFM